ncbi:NAD(P)-binding protein [Karstenula rhodostoma CBS 690.94]|uniref:NAD(P)-binding protein n=1 Tax=Karstenula rhodostoma CBS 690.94 TaxID=1392251 RepID=A0A9P4PA37_9PLEO|nr:NAD(P)-binding protein [Karstenula rhodostoma CBS 690.94]
MAPRLQNRVAIVTGAASGIGRAIALRYASEGAKVVCVDLTECTWRVDSPDDEGRDATHARIVGSGGVASFIQCDVTAPASIEALIKQTVQLHGRLDIMVNNAGIAPEASKPAPIWAADLETYHATRRVNLDGVYYCTRAAAAQMITQEPVNPQGDRGWIVNACSVYGLVGLRSASAYATSKGGVASLTRAAALDCAPYGVHVNAVNPGYVKSHLTDALFRSEDPRAKAAVEQLEAMHPLHGVGNPEDVVGAYVFLASEDARWMTGVNLAVDGGFTAQ